MDYSTSGLENPLTHLLLAVFFIVYCGKGEGMRRVFAVSLIAGLGILNRMDTILLYAPALIYELFRYRSARACCIALAGFAPFIVWEGFSLFYYGFLFPNPAYAKLMNAGLAMTDLFRNGGFYFLNSLKTDPVTLPAIAAAMVYPFVFRDRRLMALAAGVLLYLLYILRIGGDFMSGRFFSAPFFLATLILASDPWVSRRRVLWVILAGAMVLGALSPAAPLLSGRNYTMISDMEPYYWDDHGIADERAFYFRWFGLIRDQPSSLSPETSLWTQFGRASRTEGSPVKFFESVGILGQEAGPGVHIVDVYGLCDPLLARLPPAKGISHRAGHYTRVIPAGYLDTLLHGDNRIVDERLARYYDKLSLITRGDLWDMKRLSAIWNMTWGRYGDPKDYGDYAEPLSPIPSSGTESFPDG